MTRSINDTRHPLNRIGLLRDSQKIKKLGLAFYRLGLSGVQGMISKRTPEEEQADKELRKKVMLPVREKALDLAEKYFGERVTGSIYMLGGSSENEDS